MFRGQIAPIPETDQYVANAGKSAHQGAQRRSEFLDGKPDIDVPTAPRDQHEGRTDRHRRLRRRQADLREDIATAKKTTEQQTADDNPAAAGAVPMILCLRANHPRSGRLNTMRDSNGLSCG
jgi:hypothetical protein